MARRIAARDWTDTALGTLDHWSSTLRGGVALLLDQMRPALLLVGPDRTTLCNDAWHDWRVGATGRWSERPPLGLDASLSGAWAGDAGGLRSAFFFESSLANWARFSAIRARVCSLISGSCMRPMDLR